MSDQEFENILLNIFANSVFKITSAIDLYLNEYSNNIAYFCCIIAEEELAKLVILPIARELEDIDDVIQNRRSAYFHHAIKQKLFTDYGLQNRSYAQIENLKQDCLYVSINNQKAKLFQMKKEDCLIEIKNASLLSFRFFRLHERNDQFSSKFKEGLTHLMTMLQGCIKDRLPEVEKLIDEDAKSIYERYKPNPVEYHQEDLLRDPYQLIAMFKAVYKDGYKDRLREIRNMDFKEFVDWLEPQFIK